jgi:hypothetical protein
MASWRAARPGTPEDAEEDAPPGHCLDAGELDGLENEGGDDEVDPVYLTELRDRIETRCAAERSRDGLVPLVREPTTGHLVRFVPVR